jgi:hypothetical protein
VLDKSSFLTLEACSSRRCSKTRPAVVKTSRANFGRQGMSQMGNKSRWTRASEISMTDRDIFVALVVHSPSNLAMCLRSSSSSADGSHLPKNICHVSVPPPTSPLAFLCLSSTRKEGFGAPLESVRSSLSMSVFYKERRIWCSSGIRS